jgi:hypothetical protein
MDDDFGIGKQGGIIGRIEPEMLVADIAGDGVDAREKRGGITCGQQRADDFQPGIESLASGNVRLRRPRPDQDGEALRRIGGEKLGRKLRA